MHTETLKAAWAMLTDHKYPGDVRAVAIMVMEIRILREVHAAVYFDEGLVEMALNKLLNKPVAK